MQTAGMLGLVHLQSTRAIVCLLELHRRGIGLRAKTSEALIELANVAPISGPDGFLAIFEQFRTYTASSLMDEIGYLERLLEIAAARRAAFSDAEFERLREQALAVSTDLISSGNIHDRHIAEDFLEFVNSLAATQKHHRAGAPYSTQETGSQYARTDAHSHYQRQDQRTRQPGRSQPGKPNYYKVLQVDPSAEAEVIAGAYRRLAAKYHPDKNKAPDANEKMQQINEAYEVLSNPVQRMRYDQARSLW